MYDSSVQEKKKQNQVTMYPDFIDVLQMKLSGIFLKNIFMRFCTLTGHY